MYLAIRYTERLDTAGAVRSVGSKGDSYDNAAAESLIGLYKTELIRRRGPWKGLDDVELATLEYVDWFIHRRLHSACGDIPPVEYEDNHYRSTPASPRTSRQNRASTEPEAVQYIGVQQLAGRGVLVADDRPLQAVQSRVGGELDRPLRTFT